jgi:RNA-directed DNA polymerase
LNKTKDTIKRWDLTDMLDIGRQLFAKIDKKKRSANHNHEVHYLAREINDWLPQGAKSMIDGSYTPRHLKRYYFVDEMVEQLHVSDRVFQHILLKQQKPTFKHVMNPNCYHLHGPTGVKYATQRIRQILQEEKPNYVLHVDIKSFYKSIQHHKLIQDIKRYYDDPKVQTMLENIITNPIETPRGYKNPVHGIALRGPLSQFFSGIFLKPLDDAFDDMDVAYLRYQDDVIILCKTKRQLNRCRRRMMEVLYERGLNLSRKKSRMGCINRGFHFLGIDYLPTRTEDNIKMTHVNDDLVGLPTSVHSLSEWGGVRHLMNIKYMSQFAWFHIQELCVRHVRILSGWSTMVSLSRRPETIFITLSFGG